MRTADLDTLFNPRTIALIGASEVIEKWGFLLLFNMLNGNYSGRIYPINLRQKEILGLPCHKRVADVPDVVDLAIITIPAPLVPGIIDECGAKGIPNAVVISSDFSETGAEGAALEREVVTRAGRYGMRIVGPNTMGIYSAGPSLCALFPTIVPLRGPVSIVSQSGNMAGQLLFWGLEEGVGFEKLVSSGNEADLTCEDYLSYFGRDKSTKVILAYIEGVDPGSQLLSLARKISREKPVVVFKGGRTTVGGRAASSHTGALAGSWKIYQAAFRQAGIISVSSSQEFMDCAKAFATFPLPKGNRVAILTRGGGWGVITADACEEQGLAIPPLPDSLITKLDKVLPRFWSRGNPVDMVGTIHSEAFMECLEILSQWDEADAILALSTRNSFLLNPLGETPTFERLRASVSGFQELQEVIREGQKKATSFIRHLMERTGKPIISVPVGYYDVRKIAAEESDYVPMYKHPERAVRVLKLMSDYRRFLDSAD
jgi:acyl-CoA synthetase (NDP forming)